MGQVPSQSERKFLHKCLQKVGQVAANPFFLAKWLKANHSNKIGQLGGASGQPKLGTYVSIAGDEILDTNFGRECPRLGTATEIPAPNSLIHA